MQNWTRVGLVIAALLSLGGTIATMLSYGAYQWRCGSACGGLPQWWRNEDSWQWTAQLLLAATGLLFAVASLLAIQRHRGLALAALFTTLAAYVAWALIAFHVVFPLSSDP